MRYRTKIYGNVTKMGLFWEIQALNPAQRGWAGLRHNRQERSKQYDVGCFNQSLVMTASSSHLRPMWPGR